MKKKLNKYIVTEDDFDPKDNIAACVYGPPVIYFFKCKNCGKEWRSSITTRKICPVCGTECTDFTTDD